MLTVRMPWLWRQCDIAGWQFVAGEIIMAELTVELVYAALSGQPSEAWL